MTMIYALVDKRNKGEQMISIIDPRSKMLSSDEETVEILEVIEQCDDYSDLDNQDETAYIYDFDTDF